MNIRPLRIASGGVYALLTIRAEAWPMAKKRARRAKSKAGKRRPAASRQGYFRLVSDGGVFCVTILIGVALVFAYIARDLPDTDVLWRSAEGPKITLLDSGGAPLRVHGASAGAPVRLVDLPDYVPNAVLAVEDRNFYHHFGVNPVSVGRALFVNMRKGGVVQGGSTITQQLAKNIFLTNERTLKRKAQEFILALWLEQKFTKQEILTLYLNRVYFGAGAYGIDAASYRYFAKPARFLSLGEAAVLAGLLKAPSRFAPTHNPDDAGRRGRLVIDQMVTAGFLTQAEASDVVSRPIVVKASRLSSAPYFIDYIMSRVRARAGGIDADLVVRTTFDRRMQEAAEIGMIAGLASADDDLAEAQSAAVILDDAGAVRAMIGGRDYRESQFNRAVQAKRQPGSAFKPFVFLAAVEAGVTADDIVLDAPLKIGKWAPDNYNSKFYGEVTVREAMVRSLNSATIRLQETVGRGNVRRTARAMGWAGKLNPGPALALGVDAVSPLQLAGAYAPFANGGYRVEPHVIVSIETVDGDTVYRREGSYVGQAAPREAIAAANAMLESVVDWGTGRAAQTPGYRAAGKTGTSQESRDAWFAGHAGGLVGVIWVGRDDNAPMPGVTGGRAPAVIWREIMVRALPPVYVAPMVPIFDDPIAEVLKTRG
ncbi:Multimodular transpeptidase-transglycosylase [hydrothermal vent metagenome]|uniref:peptidoglycan glycosyltransferase n=1 Tax=hydrothermal vent metagenome TaxID=652676 RepID=A0A3B0SEG2_9ZZZZ